MHHLLYTAAPETQRNDLHNLKRMLPYIWVYKGRVLFALLALIMAKLATVGVPLVFKEIVDALDSNTNNLTGQDGLVLPVVLFLAYGALRLSSSLFNELRDAVFAQVRYSAMHRLSRQVLDHLYKLSLRFHLDRRTGNVSRDIERGAMSVSSILNYLVFNILPTIAEFIMVAFILLHQYDIHFTVITFCTVAVYIGFTFSVTNWRMHYRHSMNALDSKASGQAVDGLLNYETVKYFNNESFELQRYDETLDEWEHSAVKSQVSMSLLNFGQGCIIAVGLTLIMISAGQGVLAGELSLGDLVLVNTLMLQLFIPLGFLGIIYRMLKHTLADMQQVMLLLDKEIEVTDETGAPDLKIKAGEVRFENVSFSYQAERPILHDISFTIHPGKKVAVVGPSGAGKSTLSRLLFRFYEVNTGTIKIDGQAINNVTQDSLRRAIGIVPQDTVLFNESIYYNLSYANPAASHDDIIRAAKLAHIHELIDSLPKGYDTVVGERGLKLSGGEKQRVAIARVILKNPPVLIFDEATSSLDTQSEQAITQSLSELSEQHSTLVIAHRLSTIVDADEILVMEQGRIVERGSHAQLLAKKNLYSQMWALQQQEEQSEHLPG